ncbi:hypothetical protein MNBD_GAMMA06-1209 [hydrothermal vent metagenome]|uniref:Uncharacterized protein n=1 Tax=hydrothermal vent metagenome TaxID=652676 RepID=A0A3B0X916_9ZZZZ
MFNFVKLNLLIKVFAAITLSAAINSVANAEQQSKRIEVYSLSQNYWDTRYGDTLGEIAHHLLPNNPTKRTTLKQDILHLNPQAFISGDPEQLLADKRLWLPGYMKQADSKANPRTTTVEHFSWGNIKRQR